MCLMTATPIIGKSYVNVKKYFIMELGGKIDRYWSKFPWSHEYAQ